LLDLSLIVKSHGQLYSVSNRVHDFCTASIVADQNRES
jgi:hypothetical protein